MKSSTLTQFQKSSKEALVQVGYTTAHVFPFLNHNSSRNWLKRRLETHNNGHGLKLTPILSSVTRLFNLPQKTSPWMPDVILSWRSLCQIWKMPKAVTWFGDESKCPMPWDWTSYRTESCSLPWDGTIPPYPQLTCDTITNIWKGSVTIMWDFLPTAPTALWSGQLKLVYVILYLMINM